MILSCHDTGGRPAGPVHDVPPEIKQPAELGKQRKRKEDERCLSWAAGLSSNPIAVHHSMVIRGWSFRSHDDMMTANGP